MPSGLPSPNWVNTATLVNYGLLPVISIIGGLGSTPDVRMVGTVASLLLNSIDVRNVWLQPTASGVIDAMTNLTYTAAKVCVKMPACYGALGISGSEAAVLGFILFVPGVFMTTTNLTFLYNSLQNAHSAAYFDIQRLRQLYISGRGTPMMDGRLSAGEWTGALVLPATFTDPAGVYHNVSVFVMNDNTNLSVAMVGTSEVVQSFQMDFFNDHGATTWSQHRVGDDAFGFGYIAPNYYFQDDFFGGFPSQYFPLDASAGGATNLSAAGSTVGALTVAEMAHPLNSGDSHDMALHIGSVVPFVFGYGYSIGPAGYTAYWQPDHGGAASGALYRLGLLQVQ